MEYKLNWIELKLNFKSYFQIQLSAAYLQGTTP